MIQSHRIVPLHLLRERLLCFRFENGRNSFSALGGYAFVINVFERRPPTFFSTLPVHAEMIWLSRLIGFANRAPVLGRETFTGSFKVAIRGAELNANMDIIVKDNRQIIEIQFINNSLIGLRLVLNKG
jgi:hypothetical protein